MSGCEFCQSGACASVHEPVGVSAFGLPIGHAVLNFRGVDDMPEIDVGLTSMAPVEIRVNDVDVDGVDIDVDVKCTISHIRFCPYCGREL